MGKPDRTTTLRILIVDDNRDAADTLADVLKLAGFVAEAVYDARTALAVAHQQPPGLVFLDLSMPRIDGLTLARQLRELPGLQDAVFVCLTGHPALKYQRLAEQAGCDHFILKPADPDEILKLAGAVASGQTDGLSLSASQVASVSRRPASRQKPQSAARWKPSMGR